MGFHLLKKRHIILGLHTRIDFHLIKLVQTVEAAHIPCCKCSLTAPTCRESAVLYRELVGGGVITSR